MNKKVIKYIKLAITFGIVALFVWFLVLYPYIKFKGYEKAMEKAGKRYFSINSIELPSGERIKTITLQDLYYKSFLNEDFYIPYTKKPCSLKESFIKVKRVDGEYKYYTYLQCGVIASNIDHKGPTITLNGKEDITITRGDEFTDPGVKSVVDNVDGKMNTNKVTIKGKVDTTKVGTYEVTYSALDSLNNKTEVVRKVNVVERLISTAKDTIKSTNSTNNYYMGDSKNSYLLFSGMLFRIMAVDGNNVKIVANNDIANVNYEGIDKWLSDYFYKHLTKESKKLIVNNKYCNMKVTNENLNSTECSSYTGSRSSYIPSIVDVNLSKDEQGNTYLKPSTMSWIAESMDDNTGYVIRNYFFGEYYNDTFLAVNKKYNFGVRPVITIKGDTLIKSGTGTVDNPYTLGDIIPGKVDDKVNTRFSGEYLNIAGNDYRIIETLDDGTTKVIGEYSIFNDREQITTRYNVAAEEEVYNPKQQGNVGYFINNKISEYINTSYFVNHQIEVPIYKNDAAYGKESETKKYKVKLSAPNMYEMFSTFNDNSFMKSYWLINSSLNNDLKYAVSDIGSVMYYENGAANYDYYGIRPVGYLNKNCSIVSGKGTKNNPYIIDK